MLIAGELGLTIACFAIAVALVWYGRLNSHRLSQNGFVFVYLSRAGSRLHRDRGCDDAHRPPGMTVESGKHGAIRRAAGPQFGAD
jgi:hypothetical protein